MQEHIIELSNRYALKLDNEHSYVIYKIELKENGTYERIGGKVCKNLESVFDTLAHCELMDEDVVSLADCNKTLKAIHAEVKRIAEIQASYAHP
ncbi:hypothetical protein BKG93_09880 [Rodentibacter ratti]|uniref:DUF5405 domain-containing protein n=1 Tax=Rodentibacter ratti TaxID=1906745 RepID=A0A1V3L1W3_9PAST|nr:hypothetical protein [Rodentibacter ratti]OOF83518.1 hypothetical protein BKG93_09880 [Rodentibacter ratti]